MEWQPIETAPKRFEPAILAFRIGDDGRPMIFIARWANPKTLFSSNPNDHMNANPSDFQWVYEWGRIIQPTHWMPLPEPPK